MAWIRACGGGSPAVPNGKTVTPINDVEIWQQCAGIANPTYTTLADVLADTSISSTLMATDNAVDYLVRSTTFASDVCADANAVTYIGQSNYASDTLLDNSTWRTAICNSTYFESVLNVKVPNMTSNTTPSGVCSASSELSGYPAYKAFNDNSSGTDQWTGTHQGSSVSNTYIRYGFGTQKRVYKAYVDFSTYWCSSVTFRIQGIKDGVSTDLTESLHVIQGYIVFTKNTGAYDYYNVAIDIYNCTSSVYVPKMDKVQFYGRDDV